MRLPKFFEGRHFWVRTALLVALSFLLRPSLFAETPINPKDFEGKKVEVLFFGNSMTYYWNMPVMFQKVAEKGNPGLSLSIERSVAGGQNLEYHWEKGKAKELLEKPRDVLVLQPYKKQPEDMEKYLPLYVEAARAKNPKVKIVLYWTGYVRTQTDKDMTALYEAYTAAAKKYDLIIVPSVYGWMELIKTNPPELSWRVAEKDYHPAPKTSYMVACLMYACIFGMNPVGSEIRDVPTLDTDNSVPKKFETLTAEEAALFQNIALAVAKKYSLVPVQGEPVKVEIKSEPAKTDVPKSEPAKTESAKSDVKSDAKTDVIKSETK